MTATHVPGLLLTDHTIQVPLDHSEPEGEQITLYAREVATRDSSDKPYLVFLQGGPGSEAPRPSGVPSSPPWLARALADYRVLMLDQRGTGASTPFGLDDLKTGTPEQVAARLTHFRADSIVEDAELLRAHLGVQTWSLLGQSFGGFTSLAYLCRYPHSLAEVYITGGLAAVDHSADEVYASTYETMRRKSLAYYRRFPGDRDRMRALLAACNAGEVVLPNGDVVTPRLLRTIGLNLGAIGGLEAVHYLLEADHCSARFRYDLEALLPFGGRNPLYYVLHESSCCNGGATRWSAQRVMPADFQEDLTLFTAEHVFDWHLEDRSELAPYAEVTRLLAEHDWPRLYDADALRQADVPVAAAIYSDDAYVTRAFSEETAALLPRMRAWVTSEYEHNGLRFDGAKVLDRLIALARDETY
ncbi:alpha/beta fold hydrolase [Gephyromycinifex aptenodytis]|uniref:alpha/beta fold hydrolase n=1 Tax=Gephyromycinifex aptenodytis TaxID=2716227 RepID=UPI0014480817|nr:alpha/beta fold hydrolase [Gephyromycinifex aptenodytis]